MWRLFALIFLGSITICEGFHWSTCTRLVSQHQRLRPVLFAKPMVGDVVSAKIDKVFTAFDPHAVLSVKNEGELFKARMATIGLTPAEKKSLQVGAEMKVVVANNKGPQLEVKLPPTPPAAASNNAAKDASDSNEPQWRSQFKRLSKNGNTVLMADFIASPEMRSLMLGDIVTSELIDELLVSMGLSKASAITVEQFIGINLILQEFVKMSERPFSEEELDRAVAYAEKHYKDPIPLDNDAAAAVVNQKPTGVANGVNGSGSEDSEEKAWEDRERKKQFLALSKDDGKSVAVSDFVAQELIAGLLEEGSLQPSTLNQLLAKVGSSMSGRLSLSQFQQLSASLDEVLEEEYQRMEKESDNEDQNDDSDDENEGDIEKERSEITNALPASLYLDWFTQLSKDGGKTVTLDDFLADQEVSEMLSETAMDEGFVRRLAKKCSIDVRMTLDQFKQLNDMIAFDEPDHDRKSQAQYRLRDDNTDEEEEEEGEESDGNDSDGDMRANSNQVNADSKAGGTASGDEQENEELAQYDRELFSKLSRDGGKTVTVQSMLACEDLQEFIQDGSLTASTVEAMAKRVKPSAKEAGLTFTQFVQLNQMISDYLDEVLDDSTASSAEGKDLKNAAVKAKQQQPSSSAAAAAVMKGDAIDRKLFLEHSQDGGQTVSAKQYLDGLRSEGVIDEEEQGLFMRQVTMDKNGGLNFVQFAELNEMLSHYCGEPTEGMDDVEDVYEGEEEPDFEGHADDPDWREVWESEMRKSKGSSGMKPSSAKGKAGMKNIPGKKNTGPARPKGPTTVAAGKSKTKVNPYLFMKAGATPIVQSKKKTKPAAAAPVVGTLDPKDIDTIELAYKEGDSLPDLDNGIYESHEDVFERLSEGGNTIKIEDFLQLQAVKDFLVEGRLDLATLKVLVERATGAAMSEQGRLTFDQFCDLVEDIDDLCGYDEGIQTQAMQAEDDNNNAEEEEVVGRDEEEQRRIDSYRQLYSDLTTMSNNRKLSVRYFRAHSTVKDLMASGELTKDMLVAQLKLVKSDLSGFLTFSQFYRLSAGLEQAMEEKKGKTWIEKVKEQAESVSKSTVSATTATSEPAVKPVAVAVAESIQTEGSEEASLDKKIVEDQFQLLLDQATQKKSGAAKRPSTLSVKDFKQWEDVRYMIDNKITSETQVDAVLATVLGADAVTAKKSTGMTLDQFRRIVAGLDLLQENYSSNGHEGFDTFDDHDPATTMRGSSSNRKEEKKQKSREEAEAAMKEPFDQLRGSGETVTVSQYLKWKKVADLTSYELIDEETVKTLVQEAVGNIKKGKKAKKINEVQLTLPQFVKLTELVEKTAKVSKSYDSDDDDDSFDNMLYDVVPEEVAREILIRDHNDPQEMAAKERAMMKEIFAELAGSTTSKTLDLAKFMKWDDVRDMIGAGLMSEKNIRDLIAKVTKKKNAQYLTFQQFLDVAIEMEERAEEMGAFETPSSEGDGSQETTDEEAVEFDPVEAERQAFQSLNPDTEGRITLKQFRLWRGMKRLLASQQISEDQLKQIVKQVDTKDEKKLTYSQFSEVMQAVQNKVITGFEQSDSELTAENVSESTLSTPVEIEEAQSPPTPFLEEPSVPPREEIHEVQLQAAVEALPTPPVEPTVVAIPPGVHDRFQSLYNSLKGPDNWLHITKFKASSIVKDALSEGHVTEELIDEMIDAITKGSKAFMKFNEFKQLTELIEKTSGDLQKLSKGEELQDLDDIEDNVNIVLGKQTSNAVNAALAKNTNADPSAVVGEVKQHIKEEEEEVLSPEEQRKLDMEMFQSFYPDKISQTISIKQIRKWHVIEDCVENDEISDPELQTILNEVDPEGTKRLDFKQFCALVRAVEAKIEENALDVEQNMKDEPVVDTTDESQSELPTTTGRGFRLPLASSSSSSSSAAASSPITTTATMSLDNMDMASFKALMKKNMKEIRAEMMPPVRPEAGRGFARPSMAEIRKEAREQQRAALKEAKRNARLTRKAALANSTLEEMFPTAAVSTRQHKPATYAEKLYDSLKGMNPELPIGLFKSWDYIRTRVEKNILTETQIDEILDKAGRSPSNVTLTLKTFSTAILVIYDVVRLFHETKHQLRQLEKETLQEADIAEDDMFELPVKGRGTRKSRRDAKKRLKKSAFSKLTGTETVLEEQLGPDKSDSEVMLEIYNDLKDPRTNVLTVEKLFDWEEIRELIRSGALSHTNLRAAVDMCGFKDRIVEPSKFGDFLRAVDTFVDSSRLNPMNLHPRALPKDEAAVPLASPGRVRPTAIRSRRSSTKDSPAVTTGANSIIHGIQYDFGNEFAEYSEVKEEQEPAETTEQQYRRLCNGNAVLPEKDFRKNMKEYQSEGYLSKEQLEHLYKQTGIVKNEKVTLDQFEQAMAVLEGLEGEA